MRKQVFRFPLSAFTYKNNNMAEDNNLDFGTNVPESAAYTDDSIRHLSDAEHIRLRPGMYIGTLGDGSQSDDGIYVLLK